MIRTTPRALRKGLCFLNAGLLGLLALGTWSWLGAEPPAAVADTDAERVAYVTARRSGLRWRPQSPVSDAAFERTFLRFAKQTPRHWPFSGPMPPTPAPDVPPPHSPAPAQDLAALGFVHIVITGQGEPVVGFTFHGPPLRRVHVAPGEWLRPSTDAPARFRLLAVERLDDDRCRVHYEVMDGERVLREASLDWDRRGTTDRPGTGGIGPVGSTPDARGEDGPGTGPAGRSVVPVATLEAMAPTRHINPRNRRDRVIEFDPITFDALRGQGIGALLKHVKTAPAVDPATGRTLGIRIVGHEARLPADRFDVRKGDILVSIAGQPVASRADVLRVAATLDPERLVPVVIDRHGTLHTYRVDARDPRTKRAVRYFDLP